MKKKLLSIILSLSMAFTMMISSATLSWAATTSSFVPTASLFDFLLQQNTPTIGTDFSLDDLQKILKQYGLTDMTGLVDGLNATDLQSLLKLFEGNDLSGLVGNLDLNSLSTLISKLNITDLSTLVGKLDIKDLSTLVGKLDFKDLTALLDKFNLADLGKLFDNTNIADVRTLTKATVDKAAGGSTNTVIRNLVQKAYTEIDAAKTKDAVIAAGDKYVESITVALEAIKADEEQKAAEQREAELRAAAEKLAAERKLAEETKLVQNKLQLTSKGSFKVSFVAPALDGIVNYEIQRATDKEFTKSLKTYTTSKLTLTNSKNLKKGTKYYFRVRANVQLSDSSVVATDWSNVRYTKATKTR